MVSADGKKMKVDGEMTMLKEGWRLVGSLGKKKLGVDHENGPHFSFYFPKLSPEREQSVNFLSE